MKSLPTLLLVALVLVAANTAITQAPPTNTPTRHNSDPAIVGKLREVVTIRQRLVEANERAVQNGKGEADGRHELALAKARLQLAQELGNDNEQVVALKDVLKVQQRLLEDAQKRAAVGGASPGDVDLIRVEVLKAEVKLLRAQNSFKRP